MAESEGVEPHSTPCEVAAFKAVQHRCRTFRIPNITTRYPSRSLIQPTNSSLYYRAFLLPQVWLPSSLVRVLGKR